ncbi:MAG: hypothetical protein K2Y20_13055, partial [Sphingomonas sp.]|nr:hypothetical protein [Sphingomonas sp.]
VEKLLGLFRMIWPTGTSANMLIYNDLEQLSPTEKNLAGLARMRMPRLLWDVLSESGRRTPHEAARAIALRVIFTVRRAEFDSNEPSWSTFCEQVVFAARAQPEFHCSKSLGLHGTEFRRSDRPQLPLADCEKLWCPCRWDWVTD